VGDQVEIIELVSLLLNKGSVNDGAGARVEAFTVGLREETVLNVSIHKAVDDLRLVASLLGFQGLYNVAYFKLLDKLGHRGTSHTVAVDHDLLGKSTGVFSVNANSFYYEVSQIDGSLLSDHFFLSLLERELGLLRLSLPNLIARWHLVLH
jgi:hypothetical protein